MDADTQKVIAQFFKGKKLKRGFQFLGVECLSLNGDVSQMEYEVLETDELTASDVNFIVSILGKWIIDDVGRAMPTNLSRANQELRGGEKGKTKMKPHIVDGE